MYVKKKKKMEVNNMSYRDLAKRIKAGFNDLKTDETFKTCNIIRNDKLISEITVENDAEFKAIIIGDTTNNSKSRGYMYLFYTNDRNIPFPSIKEIERRLRIVANKEILDGDDVGYHDWDRYGSLEKQREYFSEIITKAALKRQQTSSEQNPSIGDTITIQATIVDYNECCQTVKLKIEGLEEDNRTPTERYVRMKYNDIQSLSKQNN